MHTSSHLVQMIESLKSWDGEVDIVTRLWTRQSGVWILAGEIIFTEMSRMALGPIQPLMQWVYVFFHRDKVAREWSWPFTSI